MICKNCGTDNKPGSKFCEKCGTVLVEAAGDIQPMTDSSEQKTVLITDVQNEVPAQPTPMPMPTPAEPVAMDASDDSTTVLTGELRTPMGGAPAFGNGQAPVFQNQEVQQAAPVQPGTPVQPGMQQAAPAQPKPEKPAKQPKEKKPKDPNKKFPVGALVYIILSAALIVIMFLVLVVGGFLTSKKSKDLKTKLDTAEADNRSTTAYYEDQVADLNSQIASKDADIADLENRIALYEEDLNKSEETNDSYAKYDPLIKFAKENESGQGYDDFFASDTVVHLRNGQVAVRVYFENPTEENTIEYLTSDSSIASCSWGNTWKEGHIATLYIENGGTKGNTTVTLSNSVNDETITIYVFAD